MREQLAKLISLTLSVIVIANLSAVAYLMASPNDDATLLGGSPKTIWVDDDFIDDPPNHKWDTVQEGVYDAAKGDTVYVFNGTYYENVQVSVPISLMGEDWRSTIIDGGGNDDVLWTVVDSVLVTGFTITNGGSGYEEAGIRVSSNNNNISGNFVDSNDLVGINLYSGSGNLIANNIISNNEADGIRIISSPGNVISGNIIDSNDQNGIESVVSNDNLITKNNISNNEGAILLDRSDRNIVANNHISNNDVGISTTSSSQNTISNNVMLEDGILVRSHLLKYWNTHTIDTSNTVNGKPVYYWKNVTGGAIPAGAGQVILANCTDVVIENQNVSNGDVGIQLGFSSHITIASNIASSNDGFGIRVSYSENVSILDNVALDNHGSISLHMSHNNSLRRNHVSYNFHGVHLSFSRDNSIVNNSVTSNDRYGMGVFSFSSSNIISNNLLWNNSDGVYIVNSHNNTIYHNNIIDNEEQAIDNSPEDNNWHHPTLLEGNYWSDYTGVDDGSGTGKHAIVGDGIGDTLIPHPGTDFDFYPFTEPGGWEIPPNRPPVAHANGPYIGNEGSPIMLDGSGSYDPDGDTLQYRWDLDNDASWDTDWLPTPFLNHTWSDDYQGEIALQVMSHGDEEEDINAEGNYIWFGAVNWMGESGQSFVPNEKTLSKIAVDVRVSYGTPNGDLFLYVRETIDGPNLTHVAIPPDELPRDPYIPPEDWPVFDFPDIEVEIGKEYCFVVTSPVTAEGNYEIHLSNDTYMDGTAYYHELGKNWEPKTGRDIRFRTYTSETILSEPAYATVTVGNVAPTIELWTLPKETNISLRMAGEKWHDVSIELHENGFLMAQGNLTRYPGSPNDQMLSLAHLDADISKNYSAIVTYTPEDDPINGQPNGANPCWIILRFDDGEELWLHHTFNVRHEETYVWEVDLTRAILMHGITFKATAYDPGADDLTFHWDFGDGTNTTSFYPNTNGTYPVIITETVTHAFPGSGTCTITMTVEDDDSGKGTATFTIYIP